MEKTETTTHLNRLRWRCTHRAMLEMDILLGTFLDQFFPGLTPEQQEAFSVLADREDQELWPLIIGKQKCDDPVQAEVVAMMRNVRIRQ